MRIEAPAGAVDLVLVGVDELCIRMSSDFKDGFGERMRPQHVIVVEQSHPLTGCKLQGSIGGAGDVAVAGSEDHLDAGVLLGVFAQQRGNVRLIGAVVGYAQLPVLVKL